MRMTSARLRFGPVGLVVCVGACVGVCVCGRATLRFGGKRFEHKQRPRTTLELEALAYKNAFVVLCVAQKWKWERRGPWWSEESCSSVVWLGIAPPGLLGF